MKKLFILIFLSTITLDSQARDITVQYALQLAEKQFIAVCPDNAHDLTTLTQSLFDQFKNHRNHINQQIADRIIKTLIEDHFENAPMETSEPEESNFTQDSASASRYTDDDCLSAVGSTDFEDSDENEILFDNEESTAINNEPQKQIHHDFGNQFTLPATLANRNVHHLHALQQSGLSCGYYAIIFAWAIQELLKEGIPLSSQTIAQKSYEKMHLIPRHTNMIELQDIITKLNSTLKVENLYYIHANEKSVQPAGVGDLATMDFDQCFDYLIHEAYAHALFITHKPGHWFLNAIIKQNGNEPYILVLDSMNGRIFDNDSRYKAAEYLADQIGN